MLKIWNIFGTNTILHVENSMTQNFVLCINLFKILYKIILKLCTYLKYTQNINEFCI